MNILFFDTETTGLPKDYNAPASDLENWPRLVQLAWLNYDKEQNLLSEYSEIIKPNGFEIPADAARVHGITNKIALQEGSDLIGVLNDFHNSLVKADIIVAHNVSFDEKIMSAEFLRNQIEDIIPNKEKICTMKSTTNFCKISGGSYGYKWPKLIELYKKLFDDDFNQHNALDDVKSTAKCFWELYNRGELYSDYLGKLIIPEMETDKSNWSSETKSINEKIKLFCVDNKIKKITIGHKVAAIFKLETIFSNYVKSTAYLEHCTDIELLCLEGSLPIKKVNNSNHLDITVDYKKEFTSSQEAFLHKIKSDIIFEHRDFSMIKKKETLEQKIETIDFLGVTQKMMEDPSNNKEPNMLIWELYLFYLSLYKTSLKT